MIRCPRCNTELPDGVSFCDACGAPVRGQMPPASPVYQPFAGGAAPPPSGALACPVCGSPVLPGEAFCDNCGASLLGNGATVPVPLAPPPFAAPPAAGPAPAPTVPAPTPAPYVPAPAPYSPAPAPVATQAPFAPAAPSIQPAAFAPAPAYSPPGPAAAARPPTPRLIVVSSRAELPLPARDDLIVGREDAQSNSYPDMDLSPHGGLEQGVSRRHVRLTHRGDQFFLEDLGSVNGTLLNQQRIPPNTPMPLRAGDHLMLGRLGLTFEPV